MKNATHVVKPWHLSYQSICLLINRLMKVLKEMILLIYLGLVLLVLGSVI